MAQLQAYMHALSSLASKHAVIGGADGVQPAPYGFLHISNHVRSPACCLQVLAVAQQLQAGSCVLLHAGQLSYQPVMPLMLTACVQVGQCPQPCLRHPERLPVHAAAHQHREARPEGAGELGGHPEWSGQCGGCVR